MKEIKPNTAMAKSKTNNVPSRQ